MGAEGSDGNIKMSQGTLYKLNNENCFRNLDAIVSNVSISNGLAWSDDGTRMFYIDSPTRKIALFDYDPVAASICKELKFLFFIV